MRKRGLVGWLVCLSVVLCLGSALAGATDGQEEETLRVMTSFYPMYLLTVNVTQGVEAVAVRNMAAPEVGCLHDYQLLPADLRALEEADALVVNGAGMEAFLEKVIAQRPSLPVIEAAHGIPLLDEAHGDEDAHDHDHNHDHEHEQGNPHVWLDPRNAAAQVRTIAARLVEIDPMHAEAYTANAQAYAQTLEALYARMQAALAQVPNRRIITFHEAFPYFAEAFDLQIVGVIQREPGSEPGTRELAEVVDLVRAQDGVVLFVEPQYSARAADIIARETGVRVFVLDPVVTGPLQAGAYVDAMEQNLAVLLEALGE